MNHFPFHIGDWVKDTAHLNATEEGIYLRLTLQYYNREGLLPADMSACMKLARASTSEQREAVKYCLAEFFERTEAGYRQKRCDDEIAAYQERARQAREAGRKGGRPAKSAAHHVPRGPEPERLFPETDTVPTDNRDGFYQEPDPFLQETGSKASHKPIASNQGKEEKTGPSPDGDGLVLTGSTEDRTGIPYAGIVGLYNRLLVKLAKVRDVTSDRRAAIRTAWQASPKRQSLQFWEAYFDECAGDEFLNGTGPYTNGHEKWRPDFDYLIRSKTVTKVFEKAMHRLEQQRRRVSA